MKCSVADGQQVAACRRTAAGASAKKAQQESRRAGCGGGRGCRPIFESADADRGNGMTTANATSRQQRGDQVASTPFGQIDRARVILTAAAVAAGAANLLAASPASASTVRRHLRESRIRKEFVENGGTIPEEAKPVMSLLNGRVKIDTEGLQRGAESVVSEGARAVSAAAAAASDAASAVQKAFKAPPRHMSAFSVEGMRSSRSAPVVVTVVQSPTAPKPFLQTAAGIASVGAGIGAVLLIAQLSRSRMRDLGPGKWVRDRSLGGRMVRVSSDDEPGSYAGSGNARWRKSRPLQDLSVSALDEPGADPRAQLETAGRRRAAGAAAAAPQAQAPLAVWWDEPPVAIPTELKRETMLREAKLTLKRLNDARVLGRGYDPADVLALRNCCQEGGVSVDVGTDTTRDALYRGAVDVAIDGAIFGSSALLGVTPARLLSGLAADLKVDPRRASQIAEGAVAFRLRGILLDAIGARRRGDTNEELRTLHEQGLVLRALPLAPDAAQLDLIASSLRTRSTPAEREALVAEYAAVHGNDLTVELVRAALGVQVGGDGEAEGAQ